MGIVRMYEGGDVVRPRYFLLPAAVSACVACTSAEKSAAPDPAKRETAAAETVVAVDPVSGKTLSQEMAEAETKMKILKPRLRTFGKWVRSNPVPTFSELLRTSPVLELESLPIKKGPYNYKHDGTFVVMKYADVKEVLDNPTVFTVRNYREKMKSSIGSYMLSFDGTDYNAKEKPWMRRMMPREDMPMIRSMVRELVKEAIEETRYVGTDLNGRAFGRLELVNQVARKVPIRLTGRYFGFPGPNEKKMYEWSRATQDEYFHNVLNDAHVHAAAVTAGKEMHAYLKELIKEKQRRPGGDDVLSRMVREGVSELVKPATEEDDRLRLNIIGTLVGGVETTQAAVVQSLAQLFARPEQLELARQAALKDDVETVARYTWEALRFQPINPYVVRYAERDFKLKNGATITKGAHVLVATHAAMLDPDVFANPGKFDVNRDQDLFFHLGYGYHRCLGDYVGLVQVPEIVMAILKLPNVRPAAGADGNIEFRTKLKTENGLFVEKSTSFPERYDVEFDVSERDERALQIANPAYAYEDYLQDYDRKVFRQCLAGLDIDDPKLSARVVLKNLKIHKLNMVNFENRHLLYCRMNAKYQSCMAKKKVNVLLGDKRHAEAHLACKKEKGGELTPTEDAFYEHVMFGRELKADRLSMDQAKRPSGSEYEFEDHMKFYDRYTYRECLMNPAGISSFPNERDMLLYARLNIDFRLCMGLPVIAHKVTKGRKGADRDTQYEKCKDGVYNKKTSMKHGALSETEKYFYETVILGRSRPLPERR